LSYISTCFGPIQHKDSEWKGKKDTQRFYTSGTGNAKGPWEELQEVRTGSIAKIEDETCGHKTCLGGTEVREAQARKSSWFLVIHCNKNAKRTLEGLHEINLRLETTGRVSTERIF
jgi:hypothetical protein